MTTTPATDTPWRRLVGDGRRRDVLFLITVVVLGALAVRPALSGDGTTLAMTQVVGSAFAIMIAAAGLNLLTGYAKLVSLGQGAFFAIGAYASAWLTLDGGLPWPVAMVTAVAAAGLIGAGLALCSMRLRGPYFAMITLVVAILVERVLAEWPPLGRLSGYPNTLDHGSGLLQPIEVFGVTLEPPLFAGVSATLMVGLLVVFVPVIAGYRNVAGSAWGRSLHAIGTSEHLAAHLGVNVFARKVAVMAVASVYGAIGGVFYVQVLAHLQPESFNIYLSITIVLAVILGGAGTIWGPLIGAIVIVLLQQTQVLDGLVRLQRDLTDSWYLSTPGLIGLLLVLTLAFLPQGIVGGLNALVAARHRLGSRSAPQATSEELSVDASAVDAVAAPGSRSREEVLLDVRGVRRNFGGIAAVDGVDMRVRAGTVHALIGPNGAGKTTLANLVTGVYSVDAGEIDLDGTRIDRLPTHRIARSGVARTFQTPLLFDHHTVEENVLAGFPDTGTLPFWRAWTKIGQYRRQDELRRRTGELLGLVGLDGTEGTEAGALSYGQQRALEIARALAGEPRLLILDEPAAGLNTAETAELGRLLVGLRDRGLAMILVEHHMDLVTQVSDEVTCMNSGRVLAHGSADSVLAEPSVVEAYLGVAAAEERA